MLVDTHPGQDIRPTDRAPRWYADTTRLLRIEIWLIVLVPARYVIGPLGGVGWPATLGGIVLFGAWAVGTLAGQPGLRSCPPLRLVLGAVWATWLCSYLLMNLHSVPWDESGNSDRLLISLLSWTGIALAAGEGVQGTRNRLLLIHAVVNAIAVMAVIALVQFRLGWEPIDLLGKIPLLRANSDFGGVLSRSSFRRPAGTAGHPIEYGIIVSTGLALSIHLLLHDRERSRLRRWMPFGLIALGIPIAISRSALLVTMTVLVVFWLGERRSGAGRALAVVALVGAFVFVTIPGLIGTLRGYVFAGSSDSSISTRTSDYAAAAPFLRRAPWMGRGPGTFLPRYFILDNQYLASLIEVGVIGTLALAALLLAPYWFGRGARHRATTDADRNLGQMFAAVGASAAVAAATYDLLSFGMFSALLFLYIGLAAGFRADLSQRSVAPGPTTQGGTPPGDHAVTGHRRAWERGRSTDWTDTIVLCAANSWDDVKLADRHMAENLTAHAPVLYVDPPISHLTKFNNPAVSSSMSRPRLRQVGPRLARYTPVVLPKPMHPAMLGVTERIVRK